MSTKPIFAVEFTAKAGDGTFEEESVHLHSADEFFTFVAPGGGCEQIPSEVSEIRMVFLKPPHANTQNPAADLVATLQLGMVFFTGPLAELGQMIERLLDKAGRSELSHSFMKVTGMAE